MIKKAAAGSNGVLKFDVSGGFDAFRIDNNSNNYIAVDAVRLSDFCKSNNIGCIDLLKMDIEGGEYDILESDFEFLGDHVKAIMMEFHNLDSARTGEGIVSKLEEKFEVRVVHSHVGGGIISAVNRNYRAANCAKRADRLPLSKMNSNMAVAGVGGLVTHG